MAKFEELLHVYRQDPLISKVEEIFHKWKNNNNHKKIVKKEKNIYWLDLDDKFIKLTNILFECLLEVDFKAKDSFKIYQVIYKNIQRSGKAYMECKKSYLLKQAKIKRLYLDVCLKELEVKNMLLIEKTENFQFRFILNIAPLTWNLSERENEKIREEVEKEIKRLDEKWIQEICFSG